MSISFSCPTCARPFTVNDEYAGKRTKCPKCKAVITVPLKPPNLPATFHPKPLDVYTHRAEIVEYAEPVESKPTKDCPFCGEAVMLVAAKCKHCGETIDAVLRKAEEAGRVAERRPQREDRQNISHTVIIGGTGKKKQGCLEQLIGGFVLIVIIMIIAYSCSSRSPKVPPEPSTKQTTPQSGTPAKTTPKVEAPKAIDKKAEEVRKRQEAEVARKERIEEANALDRVQEDRKDLIEQMIERGVISRVQDMGNYPRLWVGQEFYSLDSDTKQSFASVVYTYYYKIPRGIKDDSSKRHVILVDGNGKRIGVFNKDGLDMR